MDKQTQSEYQKDQEHLLARHYMSCCVKRIAQPGEPTLLGSYAAFGVVFPANPSKVYIRDANGDICSKTEPIEFESVHEMLNAGWMVD